MTIHDVQINTAKEVFGKVCLKSIMTSYLGNRWDHSQNTNTTKEVFGKVCLKSIMTSYLGDRYGTILKMQSSEIRPIVQKIGCFEKLNCRIAPESSKKIYIEKLR